MLPSIVGLLRDPLRALRDSVQQYGDVVRFPLAHRTFYLIAAPEHVQHVLQDHASLYSKRTRSYGVLASVLGNGLLTSSGACWRRQRMQVQPAFRRGRIARFDEVITGATLEMLERWRPLAESGQPLDGAQAMTRLTLAVAGRALLGTKHPEQPAALDRAIAEVLGGVYRRIERPFDVGSRLPTPARRRHALARRRLDGLIETIISERRTCPSNPEDLLARLIAGEPEQATSHFQELRDQVMTFLMAGHETTASALSWTLYLLATHPDCAGRLCAELRDVLGGRVPTSDDVAHLPYTRMVVLEALRLYPPVWLIERRAEQAVAFGDVAVPAGATLALSQYVTHRDPRYWRDPDQFDPERFEANRNHDRPRCAYFPFGGTARHCVGDHFALMEVQLVLATLWQHYHVRLASGQAVLPRTGITLRPHSLWIKLIEP